MQRRLLHYETTRYAKSQRETKISFYFLMPSDEHMINVFMSLSVECKLKTWKTSIGKRKKSKPRLSGALSQKKNVSFGPRRNNNVDGETLFFFCIVTHFLHFEFSPHETKEMEERQ